MTEKEISKLTRKELVEMLLAVTRENDRLKEETKKLNRELRARKIAIDDSGTMAEAALKLNRVFEAADAAAKQYLQNVKAKTDSKKSGSAPESDPDKDTPHEEVSEHELHEILDEYEQNESLQMPGENDVPKLVLPDGDPDTKTEEFNFSVSEESVES